MPFRLDAIEDGPDLIIRLLPPEGGTRQFIVYFIGKNPFPNPDDAGRFVDAVHARHLGGMASSGTLGPAAPWAVLAEVTLRAGMAKAPFSDFSTTRGAMAFGGRRLGRRYRAGSVLCWASTI